MDNDKLVYELSDIICTYLIKNNLCQDENCDECINKYVQLIIDFEKDIINEK